MKKETFKTELTKIADIYGMYEIKPERFSQYWKYLKCFNDDEFVDICERIILSERYFPAICVFFETQRKIKEETSYPILEPAPRDF